MQRLMYFDPALPPEVVESLWSDPDRMVAGGSSLKDGDRCTVVRIDGRPTAGSPSAAYVLKRHNSRGALHIATHMLLRSRAKWCLQSGKRLLEVGLRTPRPLAIVEDRRLAILRLGSYLLTEFQPGRTLFDWVDAHTADAAALRAMADRFAAIWRHLGQLRISYGDMKASNFIIDQSDNIWLIDLDGMRPFRSNAWFRRERRKDLQSFMQNWHDRPKIAEVFRLRLGLG